MHLSQPLRRLHILLVDEDQSTHQKIQQVLGEAFVLQSASSLKQARDCMAEYLPDVLVCEAVLPDGSGLDLCRQMRSSTRWRHIPIMLLTGLSTIQDKIMGFEAGADDYVVKPFDERHLIARIRLLTKIKHLEIEHY